MPNQWDENIARLQALSDQFRTIERKALRAVVNVIKPRLIEATPTRVSPEQGGSSLPAGALKAAVRGTVRTGKGEPSSAVVDFGKLSHIADFVDRGHRPPHARVLSRAGHQVAGKPTPAHPFVRAVEDSSAATAQETFTAAMTAEIEKVLAGS